MCKSWHFQCDVHYYRVQKYKGSLSWFNDFYAENQTMTIFRFGTAAPVSRFIFW